MTVRQLWFTGPRKLEVRTQNLIPAGKGAVLVTTVLCGISAGTEGLLWRGEFPPGLLLDDAIPELQRSADYPCPYGYCLVGHTPGNRLVFVFHPHADGAVVDEKRLVYPPSHWDAERAVFLPNTETAVNLILDAAPRAGERVLVLGLGVVGLLVTAMLSEFPLAELVAVDPVPHRRQRAEAFARTAGPEELPGILNDGEADLVLELSGSPGALQTALDHAAFAGRIIVGSWYGSKNVSLNLGRDFHRKRLSIQSSQVSSIAPELRGRWNFSRRLDTAISWLDRHWDAGWVTHRIPFDRAEDAYRLMESSGDWLQIVLVP